MPENDMMSNVLDYGRPEPKNFWASRLGHATKFAVGFVIACVADLAIYTLWALSEFMDAPVNTPVPPVAFFVIGIIALTSLIGVVQGLRPPDRSWLLAGAFGGLTAASSLELIGLARG
jgi:hypothetical protein